MTPPPVPSPPRSTGDKSRVHPGQPRRLLFKTPYAISARFQWKMAPWVVGLRINFYFLFFISLGSLGKVSFV